MFQSHDCLQFVLLSQHDTGHQWRKMADYAAYFWEAQNGRDYLELMKPDMVFTLSERYVVGHDPWRYYSP